MRTNSPANKGLRKSEVLRLVRFVGSDRQQCDADRAISAGRYCRHCHAGIGQGAGFIQLGGAGVRQHQRRAILLGEVTGQPVRHRQVGVDLDSEDLHLSLDKDAPVPRSVQPPELGRVVELPEVGGLHHRYERRAS